MVHETSHPNKMIYKRHEIKYQCQTQKLVGWQRLCGIGLLVGVGCRGCGTENLEIGGAGGVVRYGRWCGIGRGGWGQELALHPGQGHWP